MVPYIDSSHPAGQAVRKFRELAEDCKKNGTITNLLGLLIVMIDSEIEDRTKVTTYDQAGGYYIATSTALIDPNIFNIIKK